MNFIAALKTENHLIYVRVNSFSSHCLVKKKKKQKFWAKFPNIAINLDQRGGFENYPRVRRGQTGERGQTGSKSVIQLAFVRRFTWETEKRDTVECRV